MDRSWPVAVLAVVLLAGCNGFAPGGGPQTTDTLTPAPVVSETAGQTGSPDTLPPGVSPGGRVSPETLLTAHRTALGNATFTWTRSYRRAAPDADFGDERSVTRVAVGHNDTLLIGTQSAESGTNRTVYVDDAGGYVRYVTDGDVTFLLLGSPIQSEWVVDVDRYLTRYLATETAAVTRVSRDGEVYYRLHVRRAPSTVRAVHSDGAVRNYTATAYVTRDGFVRSVSVTYDVHNSRGRTRIATRFDFSAVGTTTVREPAWVDDVRLGDSNATETPTPTPTAGSTTTD